MGNLMSDKRVVRPSLSTWEPATHSLKYEIHILGLRENICFGLLSYYGDFLICIVASYGANGYTRSYICICTDPSPMRE